MFSVKLHLRDGRTDGQTVRPSVRLLDGVWHLWIDMTVACMLSVCQYVRIVNFGYSVIIIYCAVAIVYSMIIIIWFYATIVVNKDEYINGF